MIEPLLANKRPAIGRPVTIADVLRAMQAHHAAYDAFHEAIARSAAHVTTDDLAIRLVACRDAHRTMWRMAGASEATAERAVQL